LPACTLSTQYRTGLSPLRIPARPGTGLDSPRFTTITSLLQNNLAPIDKMSATTQRPQHVSFASPADLRQSTLKKNMSITQTYYLAHKARGKLSREAAQADHDLRLLVGHANLLDTLMLELADAEREQERWFNQSVRQSTPAKERHVQFAETPITEEDEEEDEEDDVYDSDSSDDDFDDEDVAMTPALPTVVGKPGAAAAPKVTTTAVEDDMMEDDLEEDYAQLELVRTSSHSNTSPPELVDESDSSEDESMPPSPPNALLEFDESSKKDEQSLFEDEEYYARERTPLGVASAISVY